MQVPEASHHGDHLLSLVVIIGSAFTVLSGADSARVGPRSKF
jgi:hypothetical protein